MNQITLIVHSDNTKSCLYHPEAISWEWIEIVSYPYISDEIMEELRNQSTTRNRVNEILSLLTNL